MQFFNVLEKMLPLARRCRDDFSKTCRDRAATATAVAVRQWWQQRQRRHGHLCLAYNKSKTGHILASNPLSVDKYYPYFSYLHP
jgi:hypothetical protein